jgi:hypothetical protein
LLVAVVAVKEAVLETVVLAVAVLEDIEREPHHSPQLNLMWLL